MVSNLIRVAGHLLDFVFYLCGTDGLKVGDLSRMDLFFLLDSG